MRTGDDIQEIEPRLGLTHVTDVGEARMVDVLQKPVTVRQAEAAAVVYARPETVELIRRNQVEKGDVLAVARVAGIMAAKRTSELIPLCHGLPLTSVELKLSLAEDRIDIRSVARTEARTGVEMEALVAVSVAALTVYDMCKAVDRGMRIGDIRVTFKSGGRSGTYRET
jgi:cyclic pyranopterin monophosphate synthase